MTRLKDLFGAAEAAPLQSQAQAEFGCLMKLEASS
jgi:hypothetical protein